MLYTIHHRTNIVRNRIHTQSIQATIKHVSLNTCLMQNLGVSTNSLIRVLTSQQINLFEGSTIGFYTRKTTHLNKERGYTYQLILTWLELTRALPHVSVNETELYFLSHILYYFYLNEGDCNLQSRLAKLDKKFQKSSDIQYFLQ